MFAGCPQARQIMQKIMELKTFFSMQKCGDKDLENLRNFPNAKRVLTVITIGSGAWQIWSMVDEANKAFKMTPLLAGTRTQPNLTIFVVDRSTSYFMPSFIGL